MLFYIDLNMDKTQETLLFDGFCVLCSRFVRKLTDKFEKNNLVIIPMQSEKGLHILQVHELPVEPDEVILIADKSIYKGMDAVLQLMMRPQAGYSWRITGWIIDKLPHRFQKFIYRLVARNRYRWFGQRTTCYMAN
jgi:predicted DCC family thiol-disulfide oxidoreductase YuxK